MKSFLSFKPLSKPADYKGIGVMAVAGLHEALAGIVGDMLPAGAKLLDLGCGAGALSQRLSDADYNILAADVNADAFKADCEFRQLDLNQAEQMSEFCEEFSQESKKFDAVLCVEVIEHVENPWQLVRRVASLVKPGGLAIISTPNIGSWYSRLRFFLNGKFPFFYKADAEYGHIHPIAQTELELICESAGLKIEQITPASHLPRLWLSGSILTQLTNVLGFLGSFFMRNNWRGLCIIAVGRIEKIGSPKT